MLLGEDVASDARDPPRDLASAAAQLDAAELRVSKIREAGRVERSRGMAFHLEASIEAMAAAYKDDRPIGLEWCLPEIEAVVDTRMEPGDLVGLLGASGDLKTTTAVTQARFSAERGVPTLFLSGEQSVQQCIRQMHAQRLGVSAKHTNNGTVSPAEFEQVVEDAQAIPGSASVDRDLVGHACLSARRDGARVQSAIRVRLGDRRSRQEDRPRQPWRQPCPTGVPGI